MSYGLHSSRIVAVSAVVAVVAGLAGTGGSAQADPSSEDRGTPGVSISKKDLMKAAAGKQFARPRAMSQKAGPGEPESSLPVGVPSKGRYAFLLKLDVRDTGQAYAGALGNGKPAAHAAAVKQKSRVTAAQNGVIGDLPSGSKVLYRTHAALAGVAVTTDVRNYAKLARLSGVKAVYPIAPKSRTNSYAVPLQGTPVAWVSKNDRGENSTVAIIDSGIDYTHANFNGVGTVEDYEAAKAQLGEPVSEGEFPGEKVIGGYDLAGDEYNADPNDPDYDPVPQPDAWPLDCDGHGTHVAGTVAGYGVNSFGNTYSGLYDTDTPFEDLRIGPGIAPRAKLYGYRVFGCAGSTNLVTQAIDMASDPNGDGDTSDHVDVINMSLGSDYGSPLDADALATEEASALGITVVVASGNAGDLYDVGGSPGNAPSALTVAASRDAYAQLDTLNVAAPPAIDGGYPAERSIAYDWADDPDLAGNVVQLEQPGNADGCDPITEPYASAIDGSIAFVEWTDNDIERRCGSAARAANLVAAGATGFIYADDQEHFAAGITGSTAIPGVLVAKSGGDAIRGQLVADTTVTISGTTRAGFTQYDEDLNNTIANFSSRGIGDAGNVKPDIAAVGDSVFSAANGTGNLGLNESGTSMAAPMVAGAAALVRSVHPNWTPEQTKADLMNTAGVDISTEAFGAGDEYAPQRVGAGRLKVNDALENEALAYVTDDPGSVSASFGPQAVTEETTLEKTIKVQNTGLSEKTFDVSYVARTEVPGATYSVSPEQVTVDPESSETVTLTLHLEPDEMAKTIDPTVEPVQGFLPRQFQADASGLVVLETAGPDLRVPVYAAPRPASAMTQTPTLTLPDGEVQEALLPLTGQSVNQGGEAAKIQSTVAGFELQANSGLAPSCSESVTAFCVAFPEERSADLKRFGATSNAPQLVANGEDPLDNGLAYFAVNTQERWRTAASSQEFDIYIDGDGDGEPDAVLYNTRLPDSDIMVAVLVELDSGDTLDVEPINEALGDTDTALFDSDTLVMPVALGAIPGVTEGQSRIDYAVVSFSPYQGPPIDQIGDFGNDEVAPLSLDVLDPGVALYGSYTGDASPLLFPDSPSAVLTLRRDASSYVEDGGLGAMIVHFHNMLGAKTQTVVLKTAPAVTLALDPVEAQRGQQVKATVTVPGTGTPATGSVVLKTGTTTLATGEIVDGSAQLTFSLNTAGARSVRAEYAGDAGHEAGTSTPVLLKVLRTQSKAGITLSPPRVKKGQRVAATVRVTTVAGIPATGRVTLRRLDGRVLGRGNLSNGVVTIRFVNRQSSRYGVRATYHGDTNYSVAQTRIAIVRIKR